MIHPPVSEREGDEIEKVLEEGSSIDTIPVPLG